MKPEELLYAKTHEWVAVDTDASGAKVATIGLSEFAIESLGDLVFVEMPEVGRTMAQGDSFGEIESIKAVSDIYAPVSGEIVEVHAELADQLDTLADDPYDNGWFVRIKIADESELASLLDFAAYQKQCEEEAH